MITRKKTDYNKVKVLPYHIQEMIIEKSNKKYKCIFLLMMDCGLRITEAISLQVKHFNFFEQIITVKSLKKRGKQMYRKVPMTDRLLAALNDYWLVLKKKGLEDYIFPPGKKAIKGKYINRSTVWKRLQALTDGYAYPHMLRHTYGTKVANEGADIRVVQNLLGHADMRTTQIYLHVDEAEKRKAVDSIQRIPFHVKMYRKLFPVKQVILTPNKTGMTSFHVGRTKELAKLAELKNKKVNVYIQGDQGVGKSHLLDAIEGDNILRMEEFAGKKALVSLLMTIFERDKRGIAEMLFGIRLEAEENMSSKDMIQQALLRSKQDLTTVITKESIKRLVELLIEVTMKDEYTILIDDVTNITKSGVTNLEKLKNHFHLIVAARNLKIDKGSFLTNFEKIELHGLNRPEATELINLASSDIYTRIEDYEAYKNHIWENTEGNPLYILEMIDRYSKEANISLGVTKDIKHTTALKEINMALPLIIGISSLMFLRYYGKEVGDDKGAFMLIGGFFMIFALFARPLMNMGKRKWI